MLSHVIWRQQWQNGTHNKKTKAHTFTVILPLCGTKGKVRGGGGEQE